MYEIAPGLVFTDRQYMNFVSRMGGDGINPDFPECVEWSGRVDKDGYGLMDIGHKPYKVHRLVLINVTGEDKENMEACHTCDNPPCCNADHLYWGTHSDNMQDRRDAGHQAGGRQSYEEKMKGMFDEN